MFSFNHLEYIVFSVELYDIFCHLHFTVTATYFINIYINICMHVYLYRLEMSSLITNGLPPTSAQPTVLPL